MEIRNIAISGVDTLEKFKKVYRIVFDKEYTGTFTQQCIRDNINRGNDILFDDGDKNKWLNYWGKTSRTNRLNDCTLFTYEEFLDRFDKGSDILDNLEKLLKEALDKLIDLKPLKQENIFKEGDWIRVPEYGHIFKYSHTTEDGYIVGYDSFCRAHSMQIDKVELWKPQIEELCVFKDIGKNYAIIAKYGDNHFEYPGTYEENYELCEPYIGYTN